MDFERERAILKKLRPIDDIIFEKIAEDRLVLQEIISTILQDPELEVINVYTQYSVRNLQGKSVR